MRKSKFGTKEIKILGLSSLGGTLEFYDFIIFVFFAEYIAYVYAKYFTNGSSYLCLSFYSRL